MISKRSGLDTASGKGHVLNRLSKAQTKLTRAKRFNGSSWITFFLLVLAAMLLAGCSSGGDSSSGTAPGADSGISMAGAGVKGPLAGAGVNLYQVDLSATDLKGDLLDTGDTDAAAAIQGIVLPADTTGPVLVEVVADADTIDITSGAYPVLDTLCTVLDAQQIIDGDAVFATPLTTMAVKLARAKADTGAPYSGNGDDTITQAEFTAALALAQGQVKATLGFGLDSSIDIFSVPPLLTDDTDTAAEQEQVARYRQAIEALAAVVQQVADDSSASDTSQQIFEALIDDLADGQIDGENSGVPVAALAALDTPIDTTLAGLDPSALNIPGTTTPVSDIEDQLAAEVGQTGAAVDTSDLESGAVAADLDPPVLVADSDGDGVDDGLDAFPLDPAETADTDSDGVGDNSDAFPNDPTESVDSDSDGVGDNADVFPSDPTEWIDSDSDGFGDNGDAFPDDPTEWIDTDNDGVGDNSDAFPNDPTETLDTDGDTIGNNADTDDDNDGVADSSDAFPLDPSESVDTDGDGVGDNSDPEPYPVVSFTTPVELFIAVGEQQDNAAQATPAQTFVYQSSDEAVATVDSNGRVTGVSAGTATISAYISDTPAELTTASYTLNVYAPCGSCDTYRRILDEADIDSPIDMFEQADGRIIVLSQTSTSEVKNKAILLTRLDPDGSLDSSFGTGGHATYSYAGILSSYYLVQGLAVQSSGKILVLGDDSINRKTVVTRFNSDGTLDTGFGTSGHYQYYDGTFRSSSDIALDGSDNIMLSLGFAGTSELPVESLFIRLTTDGALDSSWDGDGLLSVSDLYVLKSTILDDGKLVAAGTLAGDYAVMRFNQDGSVDTGFGTDGLVTRDVGSNDQPLNVMALSNGDILVVGSSVIVSQHLAVLLRIDANGDWVTDFNGNGEVGLNFNNTGSYAYAALEQADGKIVVVGASGEIATNSQIALARVNADGSLDSAIPATNSIADGIVTYDLDYEDSASNAVSVIRRANGGYLLLSFAETEQYYAPAFYFFSDTYLIGLDQNGALDNTAFIATGLANEVVTDFDGDGIRDRIDMDDDQDGFFDDEDSYPFDTDNDGLDNDVDPDDDGDGIADADDLYPFDLDNDGYLNFIDDDDDGDGFNDDVDAFPWDPSEQYDTDGDGIGNNADSTPYPVLTFALSGDQTIGLSETLDNPATAAFGTDAIQYTSSDTTVVTVDASGTVTAVATGTATISADLTDWPDTPVSYQLTVDYSCGACTRSTVAIDAGDLEATSGVIELADGDLLVFGYIDNGSNITSVISRLNFDGTLDSSFNSGAVLPFSYSAGADTVVIDAVEQSDGKILLLSEYNDTTTDFLITRLNADGTIDTSYGDSSYGGSGHFKLHDSIGNFFPGAMVLQSDGQLVVAGTYEEAGAYDAIVIRLTSAGYLAAGFGDMGMGIKTVASASRLFDVALDGDKIVAVGTSEDFTSALLARLTSTGDLDTSFNSTGTVWPYFAGETNKTNSVIIQSTGQYVISGSMQYGDIYISRYNSDGTLDSTFGASGITRDGVSGGLSYVNESYALLEQSDGTLVVAGGSALNNASGILDTLVLWRFTASGVVDSVVTTELGFIPTYMAGVALTNSVAGGIVVAVDNSRIVPSNAGDLLLYAVNNDGSEKTTRFK